MSDVQISTAGPLKQVKDLVAVVIGLTERVPTWVYALAMRISIALVFWQSARTKVEGVITLKESTFFLFQYEYALPLIPHTLAAYMATYAEHALSILVVIGLATRFASLGLLVMTLVIQIFVYPGAWPLHLMWASILLYLVARGGGSLSLDRVIKDRLA